MSLFNKFSWILILIIIEYIDQIRNECLKPFNGTNICSYSDQILLSWLDGYNQCLNETLHGNYIEIHSIEQFENLKTISYNVSFWLGGNNIVGSFADIQWRWISGSIINKLFVTWCENSTYETAIGAHCIAYVSSLNCITNYPCNTLLTSVCVPEINHGNRQIKNTYISRAVTNTDVCTNAYGGAYANWWTYSVLMINWFILFFFILYIFSRINLNKFIVIITGIIVILSFIFIVTFSILWGVQYESILVIPIIVVICGCVACLLFLIAILILVSNRTRVQRWKFCMIVTIITIIIESLLMLGVILCIAHCSEYISMATTSIDKDIIAALLASIIAAVSVVCCNMLNHLLGYFGRDRVHASEPNQFNNEGPQKVNRVKSGRIERSTSPVDERIINEFYSDKPKNMHEYELGGRKYVVYEGNSFSDIQPYRNDLTQAMLSQEPQSIEEAIARAKSSSHSTRLVDEIHQAENLLKQLRE